MRILNRRPEAAEKRSALRKELSGKESRREKIGVFIRALYADFADGVFSEEEYLEIEREFLADGLISLKIKELGYRKKFFPNLLKKLGRSDVCSSGRMMSENADGYDFNTHLKRKRLEFLKITKSIGWTVENNEISDSYILYRKILQDKVRIKALDYIVYKINEGLSTCLHNESSGKLVARIRRLDYDNIWKQYTKGEITLTELTNLLYP